MEKLVDEYGNIILIYDIDTNTYMCYSGIVVSPGLAKQIIEEEELTREQ